MNFVENIAKTLLQMDDLRLTILSYFLNYNNYTYKIVFSLIFSLRSMCHNKVYNLINETYTQLTPQQLV